MHNELEFVYDKIEQKEYTILPETIAINEVYKISGYGDLSKDGYEIGYLYIPKGSGIKNHQHINDIERYKVLQGILSVNGKIVSSNICTLNDTHNIDPVETLTIIQTCKINKMNLDLIGNQQQEDFDTFIDEIIHKQIEENGKVLNQKRK